MRDLIKGLQQSFFEMKKMRKGKLSKKTWKEFYQEQKNKKNN